MARIILTISRLVAVLATLHLSSAADVVGYLGNACNGEDLYEVDGTVSGQCYDLSNYTAAESLTFANFAPNEGLFIYSDGACANMVAQVSAEECYLVQSTGPGVQSILSDGGS